MGSKYLVNYNIVKVDLKFVSDLCENMTVRLDDSYLAVA